MTFVTILVLIGALQGFVSAILFLSRKDRTLSNQLLSFILIFLSLAILNLVLLDSGVRYKSVAANLLAYVVPLLIVMPVGPLIYYYVLASLNPDIKFTSSDRRQFYLVAVDLLPYVAGAILVTGIIAGFLSGTNESAWRYVIDEYNVYADLIRWGSITTYVVMSMKKVHDNVRTVDDETSKWLRLFTFVFAVFQLIWLLHLVPYLLPALRNDFIGVVTWYPIYIPLSFMTYWISVNGYVRINRVVTRKALLSSDIIEETDRILGDAMENKKLFLDPDMTVLKLAASTGLAQKTISAFLNQHRGVSFNQFINTYRVEELKRRLKSPEHKHLTITGLGLECGFNSPATMQRAFRGLVRCSPREYQLGKA